MKNREKNKIEVMLIDFPRKYFCDSLSFKTDLEFAHEDISKKALLSLRKNIEQINLRTNISWR